MSLTTSLFTGLSGMTVHTKFIDVIGDNLANVNTYGFKRSRAFSNAQFPTTMTFGTGPNDTTGGVNPKQIGLGTLFNSTAKDMSNGTIQPTGVNTDLALEGSGFFVVGQDTEKRYTRMGTFDLDAQQNMTLNGWKLQGYPVDAGFNIVEGGVDDIQIPLGTLQVAEATQTTHFEGNLNASGDVATTGTIYESGAFYSDNLATVPMTGTENLGVAPAEGGADLYIKDGAGNPLLALEGGTETVITVKNIEVGGKDYGEMKFAFTRAIENPTDPPADQRARTVADFNSDWDTNVDAVGQTMDDFAIFLRNFMGLNNTDIDGESLGGRIEINADGQIVIHGNEGRSQAITMGTGSFESEQMDPDGVPVPASQPFIMSKEATADGESVRTSFVSYDSLGTPITVDLTFILQEKVEGAGTTWQWIAQSLDNQEFDNESPDTNNKRMIGVGQVTFDGFGNYVDATNRLFSVYRRNGAASPMNVEMDFQTGTDGITSLTDNRSDIAMTNQDGSPIGTLDDFSVAEDGIIYGAFTNGLVRSIGQIALATFPNSGGLIDEGSNLYEPGPNSGEPIIVKPSAFGIGRVISGALEQANVDISAEFVNLISASTGFSANSRMITTSDRLIQELLSVVR